MAVETGQTSMSSCADLLIKESLRVDFLTGRVVVFYSYERQIVILLLS